MYRSETRVIRDGHLVAFEGEEMTDEEAARRGLLTPAKEEKPKPRRKPRKTQEA